MLIYRSWYIFVERELSVVDCIQQLESEMKKPERERDVPLMLKLWRTGSVYRKRREQIASLADGRVKELVTSFPLLHNLTFVSWLCYIILPIWIILSW